MVAGPTLLRFRLAGLLILVIALPADVCPQAARADSLSELPQLDTRNFLPAVRDQVQRTYEAALRSPKDAEATGELGMVLDAYEQVPTRRRSVISAHMFWIPPPFAGSITSGGYSRPRESTRTPC